MNAPTVVDDVAGLRRRTSEMVAGSVELLQRAGRGDLAEALSVLAAADQRRAPADRPVVAVVGETSRGKSALVNALIGRGDLSPVDPQVTTCVPVLFTYADPEFARVWIHPGGNGNGQPRLVDIGVDDIAQYAHETNNPGNQRMVQRVEAGVRSDTLDELGLTIADTPGVGGLNSGHAELALAQLRSSDAVIMVLDASHQISPSEIDFLREAAAQQTTVIVAVTKADLQFDIERTLDEDRNQISSQIPELAAPLLIPVNSRFVELLDEVPADERDHVRAASGIDDLIAELAGKVRGPRDRVELDKALGLCMQQLAHLDAHLVQAQAALDAGELQTALEANESRAQALQDARTCWHGDLQTQLAQIEGDVIGVPEAGGETLRARLDEIQDRYESLALEASAQDEFDRLVVALQADAIRSCSHASIALEKAVEDAFDSVIDLGIAVSPGEFNAAERFGVPAGENRPVRARHSLLDYLRAIGPAVGLQSFLDAIGNPIWGLVLIPPLAAAAIRGVTVNARRTSFTAWVSTYLQTVDNLARNTCRSSTTEAAAPEVRDRIDTLLETEIEKVTASVEGQRAALNTDPQARAEQLERMRPIVAELTARASDCSLLQRQLHAGQ